MTAATRGPYAKSAAVRQRVIDACMEAFGQTGFHGATMKDIAKRAGISYNGLLHHFPSKEQLLIALLEARAQESAELLRSAHGRDPGAHPLEALRGMLAVLLDNELKPGILEAHCVLAGEATSAAHPAHRYYAERFRAVRTFYATAFEGLSEQGLLRSSVDPQTLATMTISLINGVQEQWLYDRENVSMTTVIEQFLTAHVPSLLDRQVRGGEAGS